MMQPSAEQARRLLDCNPSRPQRDADENESRDRSPKVRGDRDSTFLGRKPRQQMTLAGRRPLSPVPERFRVVAVRGPETPNAVPHSVVDRR